MNKRDHECWLIAVFHINATSTFVRRFRTLSAVEIISGSAVDEKELS